MDNRQIMSIDDTHVLLLYMLKNVNEITEKEDIKYFSHGGTTLGAVRHKGFIPWDDDIDLIMERKYYNYFVRACESYLPDELVLRTRENDPYFCEEYVKLCFRDNTTHFSDLSIDIFFLDHTDPNRKIYRWFQNKIITLVRPLKLYIASRKCSYLEKYVPNNVMKRLLLATFSFIPLPVLTAIQTKAMLAEKKDTEWFVDWGSVQDYRDATWEKGLYDQTVELPFENMYVYASKRYTEILQRGYGNDYMELPPDNKRISHNVHKIDNDKLDISLIRKLVYGGGKYETNFNSRGV